MIWLLGIALIIVFWFVFPPFRVFILIVGGILVVGIIVILLWTGGEQQAAASLISPSQIVFNNVRLSQQNGFYNLTGAVQNNSSHELTGVTLDVKAYDCPTNTITSDCATIGEDTNVDILITVPAGQIREITNDDDFVSLYDMPPIRNIFLWNYSITGTTGR